MLSGPKTQGRNIGENMGSTFIARPWDLGTKGSDVGFTPKRGVNTAYTGQGRNLNTEAYTR